LDFVARVDGFVVQVGHEFLTEELFPVAFDGEVVGGDIWVRWVVQVVEETSVIL
jgi:hypothetical protein